MLGIAIYHSIDLCEHATILPRLLTHFAEITGGQRLAYVGATFSDSGLSAREVQIRPKNLAAAENEVQSGRYEIIEFAEHRRSQRERNLEGALLDLRLSADPQATDRSPCPYVAYALIPDHEVESTDALAYAVGLMCSTLESAYALIYGGPTFTDVFMELTATPIFPWDHVFSQSDTDRRNRLLQEELDRATIGERVRGAYWGTYLGPALISALGGSERVRATAPVSRVRPYGAGGLFLQLTDDPTDWAQPGYADRVAELESFLEPARTPAA